MIRICIVRAKKVNSKPHIDITIRTSYSNMYIEYINLHILMVAHSMMVLLQT